MTAPERDRSPWPFVAAGLAVIPALGAVLGVAAGIFSPSVWLDLLALWPVAAVGSVVGLGAWLMGGRRRRHLAIIGLSAFTWLALGLALHMSAAPWLPVASAEIAGPGVEGLETARLAIDLETGRLALAAGAVASYEVAPLRTGGAVAAPLGYEQLRAADLSVVVVPRPDPGSFRFGGWSMLLNGALTWSLDLSAADLEVDLTAVPVSAARLEADASRVVLGVPVGRPTLTLVGDHTVVVPPSVPAGVTGEVIAPDGWSTEEGSTVAPAGADGWVIIVEPGAVVIITHG
ncbi:MAG: hypothetical protein ACFCVC_18160 [Acidimicrobiia bacterium]